MKFEDLEGKKVLFIHYPVSKYAVLEGEVKQRSPSKNFMKIGNDWYLIDNLRILEVFNNEQKGTLGFK